MVIRIVKNFPQMTRDEVLHMSIDEMLAYDHAIQYFNDPKEYAIKYGDPIGGGMDYMMSMIGKGGIFYNPS